MLIYRTVIIAFAAGVLIGAVMVILWQKKHIIGALKISDAEDMVSIFLELEKELPELRNKKTVTLRVENLPYYEN